MERSHEIAQFVSDMMLSLCCASVTAYIASASHDPCVLQFVKGKWVMADSTYTGGYKDNKPFGPGEFVFKNGNVQDGEYLQKEPAEGEEDPEAPPLEPQWLG